MEHTKGPWIEEPAMSSSKHVRDILQAGGNIVLAMVGGEVQSEALANARLIAAAPDLLAACETALGMLTHVACIQGCGGSGAIQISEDDIQQCQWCDELDSIKAAIAKAGG